MYLPFLRGKQNEFYAVRDISDLIIGSNSVVPIFEPVRLTSNARRAIEDFKDAGLRFALVVNPEVGDFENDAKSAFQDFVSPLVGKYSNFIPIYRLTSATTTGNIAAFLRIYDFESIGYLASGAIKASTIESAAAADPEFVLFPENTTSSSTLSAFKHDPSTLQRDSFRRAARNADYKSEEFFSDLHITLPNDDYSHFSDYSIAGNHYSETGGAAYAVALHHVYINKENDELFIRHYVSDTNDSPEDPGGKFLEALKKLVEDLPGLGRANETRATTEYRRLWAEQHYPGLGVAKKLAVMHHLEIMTRVT